MKSFGDRKALVWRPPHPSPLEFWTVVAIVKEVCYLGPNGAGERNGTMHFRSGAKVYVIDAFWGMWKR